jgi:hypothetical protein
VPDHDEPLLGRLQRSKRIGALPSQELTLLGRPLEFEHQAAQQRGPKLIALGLLLQSLQAIDLPAQGRRYA